MISALLPNFRSNKDNEHICIIISSRPLQAPLFEIPPPPLPQDPFYTNIDSSWDPNCIESHFAYWGTSSVAMGGFLFSQGG